MTKKNAKKTLGKLMYLAMIFSIGLVASVETASLVTVFFAWIFFRFDRAILGYLGVAMIFAGIATSLLGIEVPTERFLNYGLFFLVALVVLGLREAKESALDRAPGRPPQSMMK